MEAISPADSIRSQPILTCRPQGTSLHAFALLAQFPMPSHLQTKNDIIGWTPTKHALKISTATVDAGGPRPRSSKAPTKHARNTNESSKPPPQNTQHLRTSTNHRSKVSLRELFIEMAARTTDDDDDPQIRAPSPSHWRIVSRSQLRSLARTHATQTQAQSKSISRFGCGLTTVSHPQPPT